MSGTCQNCRYSRVATQMGTRGLFCRFDPPKTATLPQKDGMYVTALWPQVDEDAWCGKHQPDPVMNS